MSILQKLNALNRPFRVLAIETSCDDTAVSVIDSCKNILSEVAFSQHDLHARSHGIVPSVAAHAHKKVLVTAVRESLDKANLLPDDIDVFAATRGPGIAGSLTVGFEAGRLLSGFHNKPFYPVHHMAHKFIPIVISI